MGPRIAVLLSGREADLTATVCAVQLAARAEGKLYTLQDCFSFVPSDEVNSQVQPAKPVPSGPLFDSFRFAVEYGGIERVEVSCHLLERKSIEPLTEFLTMHAITCLVVGRDLGESSAERSAWLTELRERLKTDPRRFHPDLQVIRAPLWEEMDLEMILTQFRQLNRARA